MKCSACFNILLTSSDVFQKLLECYFIIQRKKERKQTKNKIKLIIPSRKEQKGQAHYHFAPLHRNTKKHGAMALITLLP